MSLIGTNSYANCFATISHSDPNVGGDHLFFPRGKEEITP
jgi:hypothetical protein